MKSKIMLVLLVNFTFIPSSLAGLGQLKTSEMAPGSTACGVPFETTLNKESEPESRSVALKPENRSHVKGSFAAAGAR